MDAYTLLNLLIDGFLAYFIFPFKTEVLWFSLRSFHPDDMILPTIIAWLGSVAAYMASYGVGFMGQKYAPALPFSTDKFHKTHRVFTRYLVWALLVPWVPFLPILALILGFLKAPWWKILAIVAAGRLIFYTNYLFG